MPTATHQYPLIDQRETALAGLMPSLKAALNRACRTWCDHHGLKREALLDKLNDQAAAAGVSMTAGNGRLSLATLEKWLAPRDASHVPSVMAVNVLCLVTEDTTPLAVLLGLHGCAIMGPEDKRLRDYGAAIIEERKARKRKRQLEADLD